MDVTLVNDKEEVLYILKRDIGDATPDECAKKWALYEDYLKSLEGVLPDQTYRYASAEWHYNFHDQRCPHDAWVKNIVVQEVGVGAREEVRSMMITLTLLGAYHDGEITIKYKGVSAYRSSGGSGKHGDWLVDEVRLSADGLVVHEIEFENAHWLVECEDVVYDWRAFDVPEKRVY